VSRVQFAIIVIVTVLHVVYVRQHKDSSINFAETALYWIWNQEDCSRCHEILL